MPAPVCVKCRERMQVLKNGVWFVTFYDDGVSPELVPYNATQYDKWQCPACEQEVLSGSGSPLYLGGSLKELGDDEVIYEAY